MQKLFYGNRFSFDDIYWKKKKNRAFPTCLEKTKFAEIIGCSEQQEQPKLTFIWLKVYVKKECNLR